MTDLYTGYVGVSAAARALGRSRPTVRALIRRGELPAVRTPSGHAIAVEDLIAFEQAREVSGREEVTTK